AGSVEIKRDMDQGGGGAVRILPVHGAKGLQAPVVFLPQTGGGRPSAAAFEWAQGAGGRALLLWKPPHAKAPEALAEARAAREAEDERESRRLLYVAMTRAEDRLTVCGWEMRQSPAAPSWHDLMRAGMQRLGAAEEEDPALSAAFGGPTAALRWRGLAPAAAAPRAAEAAAPAAAPALPAWIDAPPPPEPHPGRPLMPSRPDAEDPPAASPLAAAEGDRFRRGLLTHRLLQCLPELPAAERAEAARRFLSAAADWPKDAREACAAEVLAVLALPEAQALFGPNSRAEAPVSGRIETAAGPRLISGQIDRLAVTATEVLIADYKTNRSPPATPDEVPDAYRRQLAAYAAALAAMFPSHRVRTFLLWTDGPALMEVPVGSDA
ncbi:MAG: PD-(D/E)XK nuclease family protein, partial [Rhodospirillaceae bacterium]